MLASAPALAYILPVPTDYMDVTGYQPDWTRDPFVDVLEACGNSNILDDRPDSDRYWCAEYLHYIVHGNRPFENFTDMTGYMMHRHESALAVHILAECDSMTESPDSASKQELYWCAEYAGYLQDGSRSVTIFADTAGYAPEWIDRIGPNQARVICENRDYTRNIYATYGRFCSESTPAVDGIRLRHCHSLDWAWCGEYIGYMEDMDYLSGEDRTVVAFTDITGYMPEWAGRIGYSQAQASCEDKKALERISDADRHWCAEYIGSRQDAGGARITFADSTGYVPEWTGGKMQTRIICENRHDVLKDFPHSDMHWCAEYLRHIYDKVRDLDSFADMSGYIPSWAILEGTDYAQKRCASLEQSVDHGADHDRYWCAEYAGYLHDANRTNVTFADSTGYAPDWAGGRNQTATICANRDHALSKSPYMDRYWCAEYMNHLRYGDMINAPFDGYVDITGYAPDWTAQKSKNQVISTCESRDDLSGSRTSPDGYWCAEYLAGLDDLAYTGSITIRGYVPDWIENRGLRQLEIVCDLEPATLGYCDTQDISDTACIRDDDITFGDGDFYWCLNYLNYLKANGYRPGGSYSIEE